MRAVDRLLLIAKIEDIVAGVSQLSLHVTNLETDLACAQLENLRMQKLITMVWKEGYSVYDSEIQAIVDEINNTPRRTK